MDFLYLYVNMRKVFYILFILFSSVGYTQNLAPNADFEIYSMCPNTGGQISYATGWVNAAPATSPDYFNVCATFTTGLSVPANAFGNQNSFNGNGYSGVYVFSKIEPDDGRDYIQIKLNDTLEPGKKYLASMYISLCDYCDYAVSTMGMNFSSNQITTGNGFINIPNPQIKNTTPLTDKTNWMLVQDTVTAIGDELYLTIGNFSTDISSDTLYLGTSGFNGKAYYYIDSVSVIDVATIGIKETHAEKSSINIYPNPATTTITISLETNGKAILKDIFGETIQAINMQPGTNNMDVSGLENGLYFLYIKNQQEKTTCTRKIFVL